MLLDRIHPHFKKATEHTDDAAQHAAVVEVLVLAVFADQSVDVSELDALDSFDASHADWDEGPFSIQQSRIASPSLREATVSYCEEILRVDGITDKERDFLRQATRQLSFPAA
jgi:hypothetical protein